MQTSVGKVLASIFWNAQGILFIGCLENSEYYIELLVHLKEEFTKKMATNEEEKSALSPRQYTVSQVNRNDGNTIWIAFRIASVPTLFSRSCPQ